jgi:hypothetical protein
MKNLQSFGVQELNAKEIKEIDGGYFWLVVRTIGAVATIINEIEEGIEWYAANQRKY